MSPSRNGVTRGESAASVAAMRNILLASTLFVAAMSPFSAALAQDAAMPAPAAAAAPTPGALLTPERVFANPSLAGPVARGVSLSPDGELVAFLRSREDDVDVQDLGPRRPARASRSS